MDPSPFVERDLEHDAEEFIVSWARELPKTHAFEMAIHLASAPLLENSAEVQSAVQHYFATRAEMKLREFRLLMRRGHVSLTIGLVFLSVCLIAGGLAANLGHTAAAVLAREGLIIAGWVAMWRPLEIYLYEWWPVREEWKILQRLAQMHVRLIQAHVPEKALRSTESSTAD